MSTENATNDSAAAQEALLTALTTEHLTLQSAADATVADAGARSSLYVFALSSSLVAMGFISQSRDLFVPFVAAVKSALFLLGVLTVIRLVDSALENMQCVSGIARIRGSRAGPPGGFISAGHEASSGLPDVKSTVISERRLQIVIRSPSTLAMGQTARPVPSARACARTSDRKLPGSTGPRARAATKRAGNADQCVLTHWPTPLRARRPREEVRVATVPVSLGEGRHAAKRCAMTRRLNIHSWPQ